MAGKEAYFNHTVIYNIAVNFHSSLTPFNPILSVVYVALLLLHDNADRDLVPVFIGNMRKVLTN